MIDMCEGMMTLISSVGGWREWLLRREIRSGPCVAYLIFFKTCITREASECETNLSIQRANEGLVLILQSW